MNKKLLIASAFCTLAVCAGIAHARRHQGKCWCPSAHRHAFYWKHRGYRGVTPGVLSGQPGMPGTPDVKAKFTRAWEQKHGRMPVMYPHVRRPGFLAWVLRPEFLYRFDEQTGTFTVFVEGVGYSVEVASLPQPMRDLHKRIRILVGEMQGKRLELNAARMASKITPEQWQIEIGQLRPKRQQWRTLRAQLYEGLKAAALKTRTKIEPVSREVEVQTEPVVPTGLDVD